MVLLAGSAVLGLGTPSDAAPPVTPVGQASTSTRGVSATAINVVAVGIAGTAFCVAIHVRSAAMVRKRLAAVDALVGMMEHAPASA